MATAGLPHPAQATVTGLYLNLLQASCISSTGKCCMALLGVWHAEAAEHTPAAPHSVCTIDTRHPAPADVVGRARTGCGKTLGFTLPIVERLLREQKGVTGVGKPGRLPSTIVMAPTRELAKQVRACSFCKWVQQGCMGTQEHELHGEFHGDGGRQVPMRG